MLLLNSKEGVIGPWQTNGFVQRTGSGPKTICRGSGCDGYTKSGVAAKGAEQITTTRKVLSLSHTSVEALRAALEPC